MNTGIFRWVGHAMSLAVLGLLALRTPGTATGADERTDRLVLACYYPWYRTDKVDGKSKWEGVIDHPLVGPYDSLDPRLLDYHVTLARDCGIDGFVSSWGFQGDRTDQALGLMLERLSVPRYQPFRMAVYYETLLHEGRPRAAEKIQRDLVYLLQQHGSQRNYLKAEGKPVIFLYTAAAYSAEQWKEILERVTRAAGPAYYVADTLDAAYLAAFDALHTYDNVYVCDDDLSAAYRAVAQAAHRSPGKRLVATVIGGGRRVQKLGFDIDRSEGRFLRNRLRIAQETGADWLFITTWNEWYEARQIEPSQEYGFDQIKHVRELAGTFKGRPLPPLKGATLSGVCQKVGPQYELSLANTGEERVYCIAAGPQPSRSIAYVLHPREKTTVLLDDPCAEVTAYLTDNSTIRVKLHDAPATAADSRRETKP